MTFSPVQSLAYAAGHFSLVIDGASDGGYLNSVDGGVVKGTIVEEEVGPDFVQFKHLSTIEIEPISLELGMAISRPLFDWIKASWTQNFQRKNGSVIHADFDQNPVLEQEFKEALIVETTFPTLDGSTKNPAYLNVKFHPESLVFKKGSDSKLRSTMPSTQKLWSPSNFRLSIGGIDCRHVNKIDSISVKQKVKPLFIGSQRHPELEPTGVEFSNITLYISLAHADDFIAWHDDFVVKGDQDTAQEKQGAIEFLDPRGDDANPLFTIELINLGIFSLAVEKSEANAEAIKRCKIELYAESMDLIYGSGF